MFLKLTFYLRSSQNFHICYLARWVTSQNYWILRRICMLKSMICGHQGPFTTLIKSKLLTDKLNFEFSGFLEYLNFRSPYIRQEPTFLISSLNFKPLFFSLYLSLFYLFLYLFFSISFHSWIVWFKVSLTRYKCI